MALLFLDSFDDRLSSYGTKWDATAGSFATLVGGRTGKAVSLVGSASGSMTKTLGPNGTVTVGFGIRVTTPPNAGAAFLNFLDGMIVQCYLQITSGSTIELRRGGDNAILATSLNALSNSVWAYVEARIAVHNSAGSGLVKIQSLPDLHPTGLNLRNAGSTNNWTSAIQFFNYNAGCTIDLDDVYLGNQAGSVNTDLLGMVKIECLKPAASGTWNQWTSANGTQNYTQVNEADPDGDTTYNSASSGGLVDTYQFPLLSAAVTGAAIPGLQVGFWARKDDIPTRKLNTVVRSDGSMYDGATLYTLTNSYVFCPLIQETNPKTAAAWTSGGIGITEFGIKVAL